MLTNLKKRTEGFTIIEVLIVLAIAGLILLIVFLAVPALQRNQRNTARKSDVSRIGGAVTEYISNNNGVAPTAANRATIVDAAGPWSQYDFTTGGTPTDLLFGTQGQGILTNVAQIRIVTDAECSTTTSGATQDGVGTRKVAMQYAAEKAGTTTGTPLCVDF